MGAGIFIPFSASRTKALAGTCPGRRGNPGRGFNRWNPRLD